MTQPFLRLGKGPAVEFQIRDRKGKMVNSFAIPEERVSELLGAVAAVGSSAFTTIDLYGDTTFSHDACKQALPQCQAALTAITDPPARTCATAIVDAVARVASDVNLNLFVIGN